MNEKYKRVLIVIVIGAIIIGGLLLIDNYVTGAAATKYDVTQEDIEKAQEELRKKGY